MKIVKVLFISFFTYFLSSCVVIHNGTFSSTSVGKPVQYVDIAFGVTQINKYLILSGISQDALILEAKREMLKNRPLKLNEEFANYTIDFKRTFYPFYSQIKVTMSADVIRYSNETFTEIYSENYKKKISPQLPYNELFNVGDSIYFNFNSNSKGILNSFVTSKKVRVLYTSNKNKIRTETMSIDNIYSTRNEYKGNFIGDSRTYTIPVNGIALPSTGKIIAFGLKKILVKNKNGNINQISYNK